MKVVFKSLLVAVGVFVAVEVLAFIAGVVILSQNQTIDPNGITSTTTAAGEDLAVTVQNVATVVGLVLAAIAGIVYGVNKRPVVVEPGTGPDQAPK